MSGPRGRISPGDSGFRDFLVLGAGNHAAGRAERVPSRDPDGKTGKKWEGSVGGGSCRVTRWVRVPEILRLTGGVTSGRERGSLRDQVGSKPGEQRSDRGRC